MTDLNSTNDFEPEDAPEDDVEDRVAPVDAASVPAAGVVAVVIAFAEAQTEVVVVVALSYVTPSVAVVRVAIGEGVAVVVAESIAAIGIPGVKTFLVPEVDGTLQQVDAVLVRITVVAADPVAIAPRRIEVRVVPEVVIAIALHLYLLLPQPFRVLLLDLKLRPAILLELHVLLLRNAELLIESGLIRGRALLLLLEELVLLLLSTPQRVLISDRLLLLSGLLLELLGCYGLRLRLHRLGLRLCVYLPLHVYLLLYYRLRLRLRLHVNGLHTYWLRLRLRLGLRLRLVNRPPMS